MSKKTKMKFHFVYLTLNLINGYIYVGKRSTTNIDDGYLGSGKLISRAIKKHGCENFKRFILYFFDSEKEAFDKEKEIVNEDFLKMAEVYNIALGGFGGAREQKKVKVYDPLDPERKLFLVDKNDPDYISGKYVYWCTGYMTAKDKDGKTIRVRNDDPRVLSGEIVSIFKGRTAPNKGSKWDTEQREKVEQAISKRDKEKFKETHRQIRLGKKSSEETRKKISDARREYHKTHGGSRLGTKHNPETTAKIILNRTLNKIKDINSKLNYIWIMIELMKDCHNS